MKFHQNIQCIRENKAIVLEDLRVTDYQKALFSKCLDAMKDEEKEEEEENEEEECTDNWSSSYLLSSR